MDLVEWRQLRIVAGGERIPLLQDEIPCIGHAFEARVYAENPARDFLPATGTVWRHSPPSEINTGLSSNGVRVDTGLRSGQEVGVYYDPMISKLIVHNENRNKALNKLVSTLKYYQIAGVPTTIGFLVNCATHPTFENPWRLRSILLHATKPTFRDGEDPLAFLLCTKTVLGHQGTQCELAMTL